MAANLTSERFPKTIRQGALGVAGLGFVTMLLCAAVAALHDKGTALGVFSAVALFAGTFIYVETRPVEVPFASLTPAEREKALVLAWGRVAPTKLSLPGWAAAGIVPAMILSVVAFEPSSASNVRIGLMLIASVIPAGAAWARSQFFLTPYNEKLSLRAAGVKFVKTHRQAWTDLASRQVGESTMSRFRQKDARKEWYTFWLPQADSQSASDMPPRYTNFMGLAVGEFVGVRAGPFLDLRETAERQAASKDPDRVTADHLAIGEDSKLQMEREAHYTDVVNIDYKRTSETVDGAATGIFALGLTNGVVIDYVTLESGPPVMAAVEHIRDRTRKAKARA